MSAHLLIVKGKRKACPKCQTVQAFSQDFDDTMAPLTVACSKPGCDWSYVLEANDLSFLTVPKIDPIKPTEGAWKISAGSSGEETPPAKAVDYSAISFSKRLDQAGVAFLSGLQIIESLKEDLQKTADNFRQEIETIYSQISGFHDAWNPKLIYHFLLHPFATMPAHPLDRELNKAGCFFFLTPKFYSKLHGLPLNTKGGFYMQFISPYTQLGIPLEPHIRKELKVHGPLDLRFHYSKIVGRSLEDYWDKIAGVILDEDHSVNSPSVLVEDKRSARMWMVKHGLPAWNYHPTPPEAVFPVAEKWIREGEEKVYLDAFQQFLRTGRMAIAWTDVPLARAFGLYLGTAYRGYKLVIVGQPRDRVVQGSEEWGNVASWKAKFQHHLNTRKDFVFHDWTDFNSLVGLNEFELVMVDIAGGVPLEFLDRLHDYNGRLLLVLDDPLMDTLEENEVAPAIYSLCNTAHFYAGEEAWNHQWKSLERELPEALARSLKLLGMS